MVLDGARKSELFTLNLMDYRKWKIGVSCLFFLLCDGNQLILIFSSVRMKGSDCSAIKILQARSPRESKVAWLEKRKLNGYLDSWERLPRTSRIVGYRLIKQGSIMESDAVISVYYSYPGDSCSWNQRARTIIWRTLTPEWILQWLDYANGAKATIKWSSVDMNWDRGKNAGNVWMIHGKKPSSQEEKMIWRGARSLILK